MIIIDSLFEKNKKFLVYLMINYLFICFIYFFFICNQLVNTHDGLWNSDGYYLAGSWDASIGRWLLPIFTRIKLGLSVEPVNSLVSLMLISIISILVIDLFDQLNICGMIISFIISLSATFTSQMAYSYMSQSFLFAEFFALASLYMLLKFNHKIKYCLSLLLFITSLSFYQGALAVYSIIYLFYATKELLNFKFGKNELFKILSPLIVALIGCILYYLIWTAVLIVLNIKKSTYFGANELNIFVMLSSFFDNIVIVYTSFLNFVFKGGVIRQNPFSNTIAFLILICIFCLTLVFVPIVKMIKRGEGIKSILVYLCILFVSPLFCNPQKFLAVTSEILPQTSIGYTMYFPLSMLLIVSCFDNKFSILYFNVIKFVAYLIIVLVLSERLFQISIDFYTMYKTRETAVNIMNKVVDKILFDKIYSTDYNYVFLGRLVSNELYRKTKNSDYANYQFIIGNSYHILESNLGSYRGLLNYTMGLNFNFDDNIYTSIFKRSQNGEFDDLAAFPNDNCYIVEDNTVIFKIAND